MSIEIADRDQPAPVGADRTERVPDPFRRLAPRVAADYRVVFHLSGLPDPLVARTRDIGTSGLCLATTSPFDFRSITRVIVSLPAGAVSLAAQGRWQRPNADEDGILTGVQFIDPPQEVWGQLWNVVQERSREIFAFLRDAADLPLNADERMELALFTRLRRLPVGRYVYSQDQADLHSIFLVFDGQVVLETRINGWRFALGRLQRGEAFGGVGLMASVATPESAVAATDLSLLEIEPFTFRYLEVVRPLLARRLRQIVFESFLSRIHDMLEINLPTDARRSLGAKIGAGAE